jgi:hypothetical protein
MDLRAKQLFEWDRFVDEHYRDVVLNRVKQLARRADDAALIVVKSHRGFAFRAGENV